MIAMCLAAGHKTVPDDFAVHSCHCYFVLSGSSDIPVIFYVERVRDGRSFATRTVQARQRGRCIFTTTMSFVKESQPGAGSPAPPLPNHEFRDNVVRHAVPMPTDAGTGAPVRPPPEDYDNEPELANRAGPFQGARTEVVNPGDPHAHNKKLRQWYRARGRISGAGGHQAHLEALAYVSDSYFIGTVSRLHRLWRYPFPPGDFKDLPNEMQEHIRRLNDFEGFNPGQEQKSFEEFAEFWKDRPEIGMMVSLDHSIYFHEPRKVKADDWMLSEMESPWAGDGRGVVTQRIFSADGTLLATCFQEVRCRISFTLLTSFLSKG